MQHSVRSTVSFRCVWEAEEAWLPQSWNQAQLTAHVAPNPSFSVPLGGPVDWGTEDKAGVLPWA